MQTAPAVVKILLCSVGGHLFLVDFFKKEGAGNGDNAQNCGNYADGYADAVYNFFNLVKAESCIKSGCVKDIKTYTLEELLPLSFSL